MQHLEGSTFEEAAEQLRRLRSYAPFRFSGTWYLVKNPAGGFRAFRTKTAALRHATAGESIAILK